jgi:hypothetical protein
MQIKETYLHHIVLISFLPNISQDIKDEIALRYATLGDDCGGKKEGILFWSAKPNMDTRKNIHLIEVAIFKDKDSFENFKNHPKHKEVVELLKTSADWSVGDTIESFPNFN